MFSFLDSKTSDRVSKTHLKLQYTGRMMIKSVLSCSCHDVTKYWSVGKRRQRRESIALRDVIRIKFFALFLQVTGLGQKGLRAPTLHQCEQSVRLKNLQNIFSIIRVDPYKLLVIFFSKIVSSAKVIV